MEDEEPPERLKKSRMTKRRPFLSVNASRLTFIVPPSWVSVRRKRSKPLAKFSLSLDKASLKTKSIGLSNSTWIADTTSS